MANEKKQNTDESLGGTSSCPDSFYLTNTAALEQIRNKRITNRWVIYYENNRERMRR